MEELVFPVSHGCFILVIEVGRWEFPWLELKLVASRLLQRIRPSMAMNFTRGSVKKVAGTVTLVALPRTLLSLGSPALKVAVFHAVDQARNRRLKK